MATVGPQDDPQSLEAEVRAAAESYATPLIGRAPSAFREHLDKLWEEGLPPGTLTGWQSVDKHYTVMPGQLTIITGWPGSGKSEWLDALLLNLARQGWRLALYSPENQPNQIHVAKYLEKYLRKPFGHGPRERMSKDEMHEAITELEDWFRFIGPGFSAKDQLSFTIEHVLKAAQHDFVTRGLWRSKEHRRGLVIDPWNELEHLRPPGISETEYVSQTLSLIRAWARRHEVHVWMVAHPQKLKRDDSGALPIPRPDAISGSQHWWNKADAAITVWRDMSDQRKDETEIHVWKVRFKHVGSPGKATLRYDRVTGCYAEIPAEPLRRWGTD